MPDLAPHQQAALDAIYERLDAGERYTTLRGYAGTGKTYLIGALIRRLLREDVFVRVCAPTHKAAQVLQATIAHPAIHAQTIHSLLGLRLVQDRKGGYTLELERGRRLPSGGVVIVDEASMIGMGEWGYIEKAIDVQWVFVGDPAQLPPVNEDPSPVFDLPGADLEEVVRQSCGNPIVDLATRVRKREKGALDAHFSDGLGVVVTRRRGAFLESAIRTFASEAYRESGAFARLLAYRNRTVAHYNTQIREALHGGGAPRFVEGEWLVARDTWYRDAMPLLVNSEEVQVSTAEEARDDDLETGQWRVWRLKLQGHGDRHLQVLHEDERPRYRERLDRLRREALEEKKDWGAFYALRERFAQVDYAYAMTIHKAQGSTFNTTYVDHRDAAAAPARDRDALLYVAVTRPSERLALLV